MIAGSLVFPFPFQRGGPAQGYEGRVRPRVSYARLVGILSFKKPHLRQWLYKKAKMPASQCVFSIATEGFSGVSCFSTSRGSGPHK